MRRLLIIGICFGVAGFLILRSRQTKTDITPIPILTVTPESPPQTASVTYKGRVFGYLSFSAGNLNQTRLIGNFGSSQSAELVIKENNCATAINAGFYSKSNKPLGLWINDKGVSSASIPSALLNGYFWTDGSRGYVGYEEPNNPHIAFQTGPMLIADGKEVFLKIQNDEPARRMVATVTNTGEVVFISVYDPVSVFRGPNLADLPFLVTLVANDLNKKILWAINLDGGGASAIQTETNHMWEISPVGSLLCFPTY